MYLQCLKSSSEIEEYISKINLRSENIQKDVENKVSTILKDIKIEGDNALIRYTKLYDTPTITEKDLIVKKEDIVEAYKKVDKKVIEALKEAKKNIEEFHFNQKKNSWFVPKEKEIFLGQVIRPLESVGIYVPGGKASYPSSVLMNAIPAKTAGVKNLYMVTPPLKDGSINPYILVAADIAGVDIIYKIGGAQAIAALAFGTETVKKVDKIVGPGNIFVATAKKAVFGVVDIDMIAGPSEILIIADEKANPKFVAADLMSQAEHDELASSVLVCTSETFADSVNKELNTQIEYLSRKEIIKASIKDYSRCIIVNDIDSAIEIANRIAPEHLELMVEEPFIKLENIKNAGSIFLGNYSPEPLGDYFAGPNHVLPTNGTAKFFSPLCVDDFIKKSSFIYYNEKALSNVKDKIVSIAEVEGLTAHANSIKIRFEKNLK